MYFVGLVRKLVLRCHGHKKLHCCVHNYQYVILTVHRWRMWVYSLECRSVCIFWFNFEVRLACPMKCPSYRGQEEQHSFELHQPKKIGLLGARKY